MLYRISADTVVLLHFGFILFVLLGGLLGFRNKNWIYLHLPAVLWATVLECNGWLCPLTPLENWLWEKSGRQGYAASFIEEYIVPLVYPSSLTTRMQLFLGMAVAGINLLVYFLVYRKTWH